jgi:asparagine synthase (glutamine-hydrolysing)
MCGIAGQYFFEIQSSTSLDQIKKMTDAIKHRGPDGEGHYKDEFVELGHRRLAIIDLNTGEQPMFSQDSNICLTFNGEIYNYIELREELKILGATFITDSDTEVIINAYQYWGIDCLSRFNGMWSIALWDKLNEVLFLTRDRLGEKPLYFSVNDDKLIWGSEIKSIIASGVKKELNDKYLGLYLTFGFMPSPYTLFKGVNSLEPGTYLKVSKSNIEKVHYWTLPDISEKDLVTDQQFVEKQFTELFNDSVRIRMRSDVGFGAFLSGGLDSGSIVATMNEYNSKRTETFTIGFKEKDFDESNLSKEISDKFNTNYHLKYVSDDTLEKALNDINFHFDDPFSDPSAIPTGHVSELASDYVKMVLTGDGGDEVLSGYTTYQGEIFAAKYQKIPFFLRLFISFSVGVFSKFLKGKLRYKFNRILSVIKSSNLSFEERLFSKVCRTNSEKLVKYFPEINPYAQFKEFYDLVMKDCKFEDPFYQLMYFQLKVTLPDNMLAKVDRMSMAHSLETRVPFLDYRLVEFMFKVHKDLKMIGYQNKVVLRNTIGKNLPKNVLLGSKRGFNVPLRDWFRDEKKIDFVKSMYFQFPSNKYFNRQNLEEIIELNNSGKSDEGNLIWRIMLLNKCFGNS